MKLDHESFRKTFTSSMVRVGDDNEAPLCDIWSYVADIPEVDYEGYDCSEGEVDFVWRTNDGLYEHILINSAEDKDVFMLIVVNRSEETILGHKILDMKSEYGIRS